MRRGKMARDMIWLTSHAASKGDIDESVKICGIATDLIEKKVTVKQAKRRLGKLKGAINKT